jgi:hypothetical protein
MRILYSVAGVDGAKEFIDARGGKNIYAAGFFDMRGGACDGRGRYAGGDKKLRGISEERTGTIKKIFRTFG